MVMVRPTRRQIMLGAGSAALAGRALTGARAFAATDTTPKHGGSISVACIPEPPRLQTAIDTGVPVQLVSSKLHNGLVNYAGTFTKPVPELAESWEIAPDGKAMTFHLRRDVTWHDGKPFTSADVKFTIEQVIKVYHSRGRAVFANVSTVETPDDYTARFVLASPAPYIMWALHASETPMVPKHIYEGTDILNNPANNAPIGTGPFRFKEWQRGNYILYERNPSYFRPGQPYLDRLVFRVIPDAGARAVAFESGELDVGGPWPVSMTDLQRYADSSTLGISSKSYVAFNSMDFLEFNLRDKLFQDIKVRQAMAHCIDRSFIIDNVFFGYAEAATGPVSTMMTEFYSADVPHYAFDLKAAEQLLDEAGYKRGADGVRFGFTLDPVPFGDRFQQIAEYIAQSVARIGVKVTLRQQDAASWLRRVYTTHDCQAYVYGIYNMMDPTVGVQRQYWSKAIKDGLVFANGSGYRNDRVDAIFEQAQVEASQAVRKQIFAEMQRIVATDLPNIALLTEKPATVYNKRIQQLEAGLMGIYGTFDDVYVTS
jgi:peptide/nickel transport system substrate-binding protein